MTIKTNCTYDLLSLLADAPLHSSFDFEDLVARFPAYSPEEIAYTCIKLSNAKLIASDAKRLDNGGKEVLKITDITYAGYLYLEDLDNL